MNEEGSRNFRVIRAIPKRNFPGLRDMSGRPSSGLNKTADFSSPEPDAPHIPQRIDFI